MPLLKREPEIYPADLFGLPPASEEARSAAASDRPCPRAAGSWWVARVRSRREKVLARHLLQWQVPYYLPQREHRIRAGDRWRSSFLPLFAGYLFFHGDWQARRRALESNQVVHLIPVPEHDNLEHELRSIWLLQITGAPLVPHPYIEPGDEVEVIAGALKGYRGTVLREKSNYRMVVSITLLRQAVSAELDREVLAPSRMRPLGSPSAASRSPAPDRTAGYPHQVSRAALPR